MLRTMVEVRAPVAAGYAKLHKVLLMTVSDDEVSWRFIMMPGVGPVQSTPVQVIPNDWCLSRSEFTQILVELPHRLGRVYLQNGGQQRPLGILRGGHQPDPPGQTPLPPESLGLEDRQAQQHQCADYRGRAEAGDYPRPDVNRWVHLTFIDRFGGSLLPPTYVARD